MCINFFHTQRLACFIYLSVWGDKHHEKLVMLLGGHKSHHLVPTLPRQWEYLSFFLRQKDVQIRRIWVDYEVQLSQRDSCHHLDYCN